MGLFEIYVEQIKSKKIEMTFGEWTKKNLETAILVIRELQTKVPDKDFKEASEFLKEIR